MKNGVLSGASAFGRRVSLGSFACLSYNFTKNQNIAAASLHNLDIAFVFIGAFGVRMGISGATQDTHPHSPLCYFEQLTLMGHYP